MDAPVEPAPVPFLAENVPAWQMEHADKPVAFVNRPESHGVQRAWRVEGPYEPRAHWAQADKPVEGAERPTGQSAQLLLAEGKAD